MQCNENRPGKRVCRHEERNVVQHPKSLQFVPYVQYLSTPAFPTSSDAPLRDLLLRDDHPLRTCIRIRSRLQMPLSLCRGLGKTF